MSRALFVIGLLWQLPVALPIWLLYVLPFWALGFLKLWRGNRWHRTYDACLFVAINDRAKWWSRLWRRWIGHALPFAMVIHQRAMMSERVERHEYRHTRQWLWLGPLFPLVYGLFLLTHGYRNHPLERDARAHADRRAAS